MTQSIQNYDKHNNRYGVPQQRQAALERQKIQYVRIPDYYEEENKQSFIDYMKESPFYTMGIRGFFGPLIDHPIASILTWFGCGFLLNKYDAACGGEYNKSILKKAVNLGDNIQNSKFVQSQPVQTVLSWFKKGGKKGGNFVSNNSVLKAMRDTPTMPELELVKSEMIPQRQRVVHDFNHIVNELKLTGEGFAGLNKLALSKDENNLLKQAFKVSKLSEIPEERASSYIQLKRLGKSDAEILKIIASPDGGVAGTKKAVLKALGHDEAWIKAVQEDTIGKYVNQVQAATKRVGGKVKIGLGDFRPLGVNLGPLTIPTKRVLGCDSVYNRLYSLDGGAKTATGRFMSRFMQMVHRGLTFGGGKLGVLLFIAPAFVETAINVHKAEPNEKVGTGVNNLVNHISWVFTFPFALQIMHHICGAQYAGMSKDQVQKLRKLQTDFNKKNKLNGSPDGGGFKDYNEYNTERKKVNEAMKKIKKVKGQKWYTKSVRWLANLITPDLGKLDAYNTGNMVPTKFSQMRNLPRNLCGVPIRLLIFGGLTMGVLDTILNKGIKFIFGASYDSMKEEEIKDAKKEQKKFLKDDLNDRLYEAQRQKLAALAIQKAAQQKNAKINNAQSTQGIAHKGLDENSSLIPQPANVAKIDNESIDNYTYIPSDKNLFKNTNSKGKFDSYTYIPSQDSKIKKDEANLTRTYIPSQAAANIHKTWDNSHLQSALDRAAYAEERAIKILEGDFENI